MALSYPMLSLSSETVLAVWRLGKQDWLRDRTILKLRFETCRGRSDIRSAVAASDRRWLEPPLAQCGLPQKPLWRQHIVFSYDDGLSTAAIMAVWDKSTGGVVTSNSGYDRRRAGLLLEGSAYWDRAAGDIVGQQGGGAVLEPPAAKRRTGHCAHGDP